MVAPIALIAVHHLAVGGQRAPFALHAQFALRTLPLVLLHTSVHDRRHTDTRRMCFPPATITAHKPFRFAVPIFILRTETHGTHEWI